jgi:hypothetical protein
MTVLRRRADNVVQLVSYGGIGLVVLLIRHDPIGLVVGVPLLVLAVRTFRAGVYVDDDALTIRNTFRTYRLDWDDVTRVDLAPVGRPALPVVVIRTASDRTVPLWCVQPTKRGQRGDQDRLAVLRDVQHAVRTVKPEPP